MTISFLPVLGLGLLLSGCVTDDVSGTRAAVGTTLLKVTEEEPGENCEMGGVLVEYGEDTDADGLLSSGETEGARYVCGIVGPAGADGADGSNGDAGADGPKGDVGADGAKGDAGADGTDGADGADGENGSDGADGEDGSDGSDGYSSLITLTAIAAGVDGCEHGGTRVDVGLDNGEGAGTPADGSLHADEIDNTTTLCSGAPAQSGPAVDGDLNTAPVSYPSAVPYVGDDVSISCNNQGTTLDLVYSWTASSTECHRIGARVSGMGTHPFVAILDATTGDELGCGQGGFEQADIVAGTTYLIAVEPYVAGNLLGAVEPSDFCF